MIQELKEKLQQQSHDLDNYVKITSTVEKQKLDLLEELAERNIVADTLRNEKQLVDVEMCVLKDKITNLEMKLLEHEKSDQGQYFKAFNVFEGPIFT